MSDEIIIEYGQNTNAISKSVTYLINLVTDGSGSYNEGIKGVKIHPKKMIESLDSVLKFYIDQKGGKSFLRYDVIALTAQKLFDKNSDDMAYSNKFMEVEKFINCLESMGEINVLNKPHGNGLPYASAPAEIILRGELRKKYNLPDLKAEDEHDIDKKIEAFLEEYNAMDERKHFQSPIREVKKTIDDAVDEAVNGVHKGMGRHKELIKKFAKTAVYLALFSGAAAVIYNFKPIKKAAINLKDIAYYNFIKPQTSDALYIYDKIKGVKK